MIKRICLSLILFGSLFALTTNCDKLEDLIKFPISVTDEFTVPAGVGIGIILTPLTGNSETNIEQELSNNNAKKDKIKTVELSELILTIQTSGKDFSFADMLEIYLNAEGQSEILIASKESIDSSATEISLDVIDNDLAAYLKQDEITFRAKFENKEIDITSTDIKVSSKFLVTVDLF